MFGKATLWFMTTIAIAAAAWGAAQNPQAALPEGEGKRILETACTVCHSLKEVTKFQGYYSRENWRDIVRTMIADGADLKDAQIPPALLNRIFTDVVQIMESQDMKDLLGKGLMSVVVNKSPAEYQNFVEAQAKKWHQVVVENNVKVE